MGRKKKHASYKEGVSVWRRNNKEHIREYARTYDKERRDSDPEYRERRNSHNRRSAKKRAQALKDNHRLRVYGVSPEQYEKLEEECGGVCLICEKENKRGLCIDHDHVTGEVRGLLCHKCNLVLGILENNAFLLGRMLKHCGLEINYD